MTAAPESPPRTRVEPAHRLTPSPRRDRSWRLGVSIVGIIVMILVVLILATISVVSWSVERSYPPAPTLHAYGTPSALTVRSTAGDVRVVSSEHVDEVTVALVDPDEESAPISADTAPARWSERGTTDAPDVSIRQPELQGPVPWSSDRRDVLVTIPAGHELDLELSAGVGDIEVEAGSFLALDVRTEVGDVSIRHASAPGGVHVRTEFGNLSLDLAEPVADRIDLSSELGDVDLRLPADAESTVDVTTGVGDVTVALPGQLRWRLELDGAIPRAGTGQRIEDAAGPIAGTLAVTTDTGEITVTR